MRFALPLCLLPVLLWADGGTRVRGAELHLLDVGHGLAALVLTADAVVLIDTGGGRDGATRAQRVVVPYLRALGRSRIDHLVLTHQDHDHAAGAGWLAERMPTMTVRAPDVARARERLGDAARGRNVRACRAGEGFVVDGVHVDFLAPAEHDRGSDNDRSCVVLIDTGRHRWLIAGDIEAAGEARLVARVGRLPVDALVAPHHGSDTSSSAAFVGAFPTRHVVFPAARRSRWGFPHASVRMRYKKSGAALYVTGRTGALVFRSRTTHPPASAIGERLSPDAPPLSWRRTARRRWRQP